MDQADEAPCVLIGAAAPGKMAHHGLNGQRVADKALVSLRL